MSDRAGRDTDDGDTDDGDTDDEGDGILVDGIAFAAWRSFPPDVVQRFGPLGRLNVLLGPNNAGKTNVLAVVAFLATKMAANGGPWIDDAVRNPVANARPAGYGGLSPQVVGLALRHGGRRWRFLASMLADLAPTSGTRGTLEDLAREVLWVDYEALASDPPIDLPPGVDSLSATATALTAAATTEVQRGVLGGLADLERRLHGQTLTGEADGRFAARTLLMYATANMPFPSLFLDVAWDPTAQLRQWVEQHQTLRSEEPAMHARYRRLNELLSRVFEVDTTLTVIAGEGNVRANLNGRNLTLDVLGAGVRRVIELVWCLCVEHTTPTLVLIDEPSEHLHPHLLLRLVDVLLTETRHQLVLATHAAALIDHPAAHLFEVTMTDGHSQLHDLTTPATRHAAVWTLGYRPSDVLQANCVIWVEGPSDRLYLNWWLTAWLAAYQPDLHLVEGADYQFMTYGGRLLAHFTATDHDDLDDDLVERDLIALQALGRRLAIVIDSDKSDDTATINAGLCPTSSVVQLSRKFFTPGVAMPLHSGDTMINASAAFSSAEIGSHSASGAPPLASSQSGSGFPLRL